MGLEKPAIPRVFRGTFEWFVNSEVAGSALLLACTVIALLLANSPLAPAYDHLLHIKVGVSWGDTTFKLTVHHWINDGLMVIFFFVVGLEIKRELIVGQLSSLRRAALPVAAAAGGMLAPAILYATLNSSGEGSAGWGIPMATDIAFALGVLALFGSRVPVALKVFLTALAIADDLGAVLVIAVFYTASLRSWGLIVAAVFLALLVLAIRARIRRLDVLLPLMVGVWFGIFASGVHATVAGILVAMVIPVRSRIEPERFLAAARERLEELESVPLTRESMIDDERQFDAIDSLHRCAEDMLPAGLRLEHALHPVQVWFILPLFALANAGVRIDSHLLEALANPISLGIVVGLVIGKPAGIYGLSRLAVRLTGASLPDGVAWRHILGAGCLAGIGFTMSLFITGLAFPDEALVAEAKIGILAASLVSGIIGSTILGLTLPSKERTR
ncbi:MAG TPA: Na+/H+ antiporter NhaA [Thermoanaerobaculales bacterium]|nr:Na+/H+ antiporter NhaA [Thermoanaerobaculales bacterium]HPA79202.1 Na+/H+ antiporter NhaA [Thermoanaerobaculales bacterium]HQL29129.1 Na+/H+ antiporter NhaA [Thermoanaerobaculales bacterium]HQN95051.1 Na+/H+ antiporter NhaA [Thermoanaerobaculales bacterium]